MSQFCWVLVYSDLLLTMFSRMPSDDHNNSMNWLVSGMGTIYQLWFGWMMSCSGLSWHHPYDVCIPCFTFPQLNFSFTLSFYKIFLKFFKLSSSNFDVKYTLIYVIQNIVELLYLWLAFVRDVYLCYEPIFSGYIGMLPEGPVIIPVEVLLDV